MLALVLLCATVDASEHRHGRRRHTIQRSAGSRRLGSTVPSAHAAPPPGTPSRKGEPPTRRLAKRNMAVGQPQVLSELTLPVNGTVGGRAPSCGGCSRRESALTSHMHLEKFVAAVDGIGRVQSALLFLIMCFMIYVCVRSLVGTPCYRRYTEVLLTLVYTVLYMIASPVAIMCNKVLMKDYGFGYPVMVSALGQTTTAVCAYLVVRCTGMSVENGRKVSWRNLMLLGAASALALVLGQYPYLYLTVAFIQMLKAFSPAYMVFFLAALQVGEHPSRLLGGVPPPSLRRSQWCAPHPPLCRSSARRAASSRACSASRSARPSPRRARSTSTSSASRSWRPPRARTRCGSSSRRSCCAT